MATEIESLLAMGRISHARRRYGDLKRQLREGVLSLFEVNMEALPLAVRSMIWYGAHEFTNDKEQLFSSAQTAERKPPPRIAAIVRGLGMDVAPETRFFNRAVADLEIIVASIDVGSLPERPNDRKEGSRY